MARPKLMRVRILANHGISLQYQGTNGTRVRFVRPGDAVLMNEAAAALGTYYVLLERMARAGRLKRFKRDRVWMIPVTEVLRLRRSWKGRPPTTLTGS